MDSHCSFMLLANRTLKEMGERPHQASLKSAPLSPQSPVRFCYWIDTIAVISYINIFIGPGIIFYIMVVVFIMFFIGVVTILWYILVVVHWYGLNLIYHG